MGAKPRLQSIIGFEALGEIPEARTRSQSLILFVGAGRFVQRDATREAGAHHLG